MARAERQGRLAAVGWAPSASLGVCSGVEIVPTAEHLIDAFDLRTNMGSPDACALQSAESMNGTGDDSARSLKPALAALRETSGQALVHGSVGGGCKTVRLCPPREGVDRFWANGGV